MSAIEWTEKTWNPTTGCTKVGDGCDNCYAENMHRRLRGKGAKGYERPFEEVVCHPDRLEIPLNRKKPTMYFVNSMSDVFHAAVPANFWRKIFMVMHYADWHVFQLLTKRPHIAAQIRNGVGWPPNVWVGASVENRKAMKRINWLRRVECETRFLSIEPLLEDLGEIDLTGVHWVIVGGESGHGARRMNPQWARNVRDQCAEQGVPFFFKQWGRYDADGLPIAKKDDPKTLDGVRHVAYPASMPKVFSTDPE